MTESTPPSSAEIEIYRQRYETFRYLDKLHWQMLQIAIASGAIASAFIANSRLDWQLPSIGFGILWMLLGAVMLRIQRGLNSNNVALREFGKIVGDEAIPETNRKSKSVSFRIALVIIIVGLSLMLLATGDLLSTIFSS